MVVMSCHLVTVWRSRSVCMVNSTNMQLRDVLDAFVCLRPDVGYVQGMSYIAAIICLYTDSTYGC